MEHRARDALQPSNPESIMGAESRFEVLESYNEGLTKGTIPSKDLIVCSTPTQARLLVNRTASLYSWDDPAPIAIPSFAQLQVLDGLPARGPSVLAAEPRTLPV